MPCVPLFACLAGMGCVDMLHNALGGSCVRLCCVFRNMGQRGSRPLKLRRVLCGLLFGRFPKLRVLYAFAHKLCGFLVSFTSISPSRVIFCVILSRGFKGSFTFLHLQSAPLQGRNTRYSAQCRYSGGQGLLRLFLWCRFRKTGL